MATGRRPPNHGFLLGPGTLSLLRNIISIPQTSSLPSCVGRYWEVSKRPQVRLFHKQMLCKSSALCLSLRLWGWVSLLVLHHTPEAINLQSFSSSFWRVCRLWTPLLSARDNTLRAGGKVGQGHLPAGHGTKEEKETLESRYPPCKGKPSAHKTPHCHSHRSPYQGAERGWGSLSFFGEHFLKP